jgi:hypothetical protein
VEVASLGAAMKFNVAGVQWPLTSAVEMVEAGPSIEHENTRTPLRVERGTWVLDVKDYGSGSEARSHWTVERESNCGPRPSCRMCRWDVRRPVFE